MPPNHGAEYWLRQIAIALNAGGEGLPTPGAGVGGGGGGGTLLTYNSTPLSLTNGQTAGLQGDNKGRLLVNNTPLDQNDSVQAWLYDATGVPMSFSSGSMPVLPGSATGSTLPTGAMYMGIQNGSNLAGLGAFTAIPDNSGGGGAAAMAQYVANNLAGTAIDKMRGNITGASHNPGSTTSSTYQVNTFNHRYLTVFVNVASAAGGMLTVTINGRTANLYTIPYISGSAIAAPSTVIYRIGPSLTPSATTAQDILAKRADIVATVTGSITYGIDFLLGV